MNLQKKISKIEYAKMLRFERAERLGSKRKKSKDRQRRDMQEVCYACKTATLWDDGFMTLDQYIEISNLADRVLSKPLDPSKRSIQWNHQNG